MLLTQDQDTNILMIIITHHIGTTIITIIVIIITIIITITTIREDQFITDQEDIDKKMAKFIISEEEKNTIRSMYNLNEQKEIKLLDFIKNNNIVAFKVDGKKVYFNSIEDLDKKLTGIRGGQNYAIAVIGVDKNDREHKLGPNYSLQKMGGPLELTLSFE